MGLNTKNVLFLMHFLCSKEGDVSTYRRVLSAWKVGDGAEHKKCAERVCFSCSEVVGDGKCLGAGGCCEAQMMMEHHETHQKGHVLWCSEDEGGGRGPRHVQTHQTHPYWRV